MANKTAVTAKVLSSFRDKHTGELHRRGSTFPTDEKRVKEINAGRSEKPLVMIVADADASGAQSAPATPPTQTEENDASGENAPPAPSAQTEAKEATDNASGAQAGEPAAAPDAKQPETKGKAK